MLKAVTSTIGKIAGFAARTSGEAMPIAQKAPEIATKIPEAAINIPNPPDVEVLTIIDRMESAVLKGPPGEARKGLQDIAEGLDKKPAPRRDADTTFYFSENISSRPERNPNSMDKKIKKNTYTEKNAGDKNETHAPPLTQEAQDLLNKVDNGGIPFAMTSNLARIAKENGIDPNVGVKEVIDELKKKHDISGPSQVGNETSQPIEESFSSHASPDQDKTSDTNEDKERTTPNESPSNNASVEQPKPSFKPGLPLTDPTGKIGEIADIVLGGSKEDKKNDSKDAKKSDEEKLREEMERQRKDHERKKLVDDIAEGLTSPEYGPTEQLPGIVSKTLEETPEALPGGNPDDVVKQDPKAT
jgi:hypothetical protein